MGYCLIVQLKYRDEQAMLVRVLMLGLCVGLLAAGAFLLI